MPEPFYKALASLLLVQNCADNNLVQLFRRTRMRIQSIRATTSLSSLHSGSAIYNVNNNNNQLKSFGTVPSSISRTRGLCIRCGVRFRPCIDIHKGKVKQIVGSTIQDLKESGSTPVTNFESDKSAAVYANLYKEDGLIGGHVIMIGADPVSKSAAIEALHAYPGATAFMRGACNPPVALVREGGYDTKVNETVNVVTAKTTEIGQKTWGIMKGVVALATQKVEEYTKEGGASWKADGWQQNESERNGYYQEFSKDSKSSGGEQSSTGAHFNSVSSSSWDDWDHKDNKKEESTKGAVSSNGDGWAGWDDGKDDGFDNFYQSASSYTKAVGHNGKSDTKWSDGGFF